MSKFSENTLKVLEARYLLRDKYGKVIETPDEMFRRVANHVAKDDHLARTYYLMLSSLLFLPNSPTLTNAGTPLGNLAACYVLPVEDSIDGIFDAVKWAALIHKEGGGTGFSFSNIRPQGSIVKTTGGIASGVVSFMEVFNAATGAIKQGSKRRGANMGMLRVDHPDILEFIDCKKDNSKLNNFNISVAVTDTFMQALARNDKYNIIHPVTKEVVRQLYAREVWDKIVRNAWLNGEPGVVYIDKINAKNPTPHIGTIEATNPCGEQPLLPFEACNLGSINLSKFVDKGKINYDLLGQVVRVAVRFLDDVIDASKYPLPQIEQMVKGNRKIGLGVMGFADMLIQLGISYNSPEAIKVVEDVMGFIQRTAHDMSAELGEALGMYPNYVEGAPKRRNATVTTIAPTGSISIIAGTSGGIEPFFSMVYELNILDGTKMLEVYPKFAEVCKDEKVWEQVARDGTLANTNLPDSIKELFVCAHDVPPEQHVRIQAAFQKYTDNAVSKTVNLPHNATVEDVEKIFLLAYDLGCKGITIYRDGSRENQVMARRQEKQPAKVVSVSETRPRPTVTQGFTEKVRMGCGNLYITVNHDEQGVCEVFTHLGKAGGCPSQSEATSRLISVALRAGVDINTIIEQLQGIRCYATLNKKLCVLSCPDAIARALKKAVGERQPVEEKEETTSVCPECGAKLSHESGCVICYKCGYSKCG